MKVLVVGSGGREHALAWKIQQSRKVTRVYCEPGNGGTAGETRYVSAGISRIGELAYFAKREQIDLTIVGPELPLTEGIVDRFESEGLRIIGPSAAAAKLEGSKIFAKEFMQRHRVPTSTYIVTSSPVQAAASIRQGGFSFPLVIKADGLAAGKGVVIAKNLEEADSTIQKMMQERVLGAAGERVIIEEFLQGEEASFLVFSDGVHVLPMVPCQDHKAVFEGDLGPNTGGMGAYSADWILSPELHQQVMKTIVTPTIQGMAAEGTPYRGILYFGLMLTDNGVKVLEFNARLGDPETQPILFRLQSDLVDIFEGLLERRLDRVNLRWDEGCSICVVVASGGYPGKFEKGKEINGLAEAEAHPNVKVFHAGTEIKNGRVVSSGGRVLGVTAKAKTLQSAIDLAYKATQEIHFDRMHYRRDIGRKGLNKETGMASRRLS
jgi:phosphoribosylamine--glycine ligase